MSDGDWSITTTTTDPAGNTSPPSAPLPIKIDTSAPSALAAPDLLPASDSGASNTDNKTNDTTPSMSGGVVPDGSTVVINGRKADGSTVSCTYVASPTVNSCDLPAMSDGSWSMSSTVTDPAGNTSPSGPGLDINIDNTAPSAVAAPDLLPSSDTGSSDADNVTADSTQSMSMASAVDGETVTMTGVKADGTTVSCSYVKSATVNSCDLPAMSDGAWKINGTITDLAGNVSSSSPALDITVDTVAPSSVAPDLLPTSDLGSSDTDNVTSDTTPTFDVPNAVNGDEVTMTATKDDGTVVSCTYVRTAAVSGCDLKTLTDGTWVVDAAVTDPAGNKSSNGSGMKLVIDTRPPAKPATPTLPVNTSGSTGDQTPTVVVDDVTPGDTVTGTAKKDNATVTCVFVGAPGVRSCTLPLLTPGQWFVSATVTDPAGNKSAPSDSVPVVISDPTLPQNAISLNAVTSNVSAGQVTAVAALKPSEVGNVANVVFVVKNPDGTIARTLRVAASPKAATVAARIAGVVKGQKVEAYTENWLGVSKSAPNGANVIRAATSRTRDRFGRPNLIGGKTLVSHVIFDPASPLLDAGDRADLDKVAAKLANKGGLVLVSGFARQNQIDTKGFLRDLSIERAKAVARYLSERGVRAWIRYQGYGAVTSQIGTWEDRKVEIRWVDGVSELPKK
jgi:outer membrane protein OmpA-like peptidoglycan-associated protein